MGTPNPNIVTGTSADDTLSGLDGIRNDFNVWQGGADTLTGGDQSDIFIFRGAFNPEDQLDGGAGFDILRLNGSAYSDGITLGTASLVSVEEIQFAAGANYSLTTVDANVLKGRLLVIDGAALGANNALTFDGSAETDGHFHIVGGFGDDTLTGGQGKDIFILRNGGADTVHGGDGNDQILMNDTTTNADVLDGGAGSDTVVLEGLGLQDSLPWAATSLTSVERLYLDHGFNYSFTGNDANIAAHKTMIVQDNNLDPGSTLFYDGSAETDGHYIFKIGAATATLIGGAQSDRFDGSLADDMTVTGGGGKDLIIANTGFNSGDTFLYNAASDSTSLVYDTIRNVDFQSDTFIAPWGTVTSITDFDGGHLSKATFDADIGTALGDVLTSHRAMVFDATTGDMAGHSFLVIDVNGATGYQAGADLVIDVTGYTGLGGGS